MKLEVTFHARAQRGQAEPTAHELDLVKHGFKKEHAEVSQGGIREVAPAVEIAAPATVSGCEAGIHRLSSHPFFHELLDGDVGQTELLVVTLDWIVREVALHRPFNIARYGFVPFNQVRVVAVHRPDQIGHPFQDLG